VGVVSQGRGAGAGSVGRFYFNSAHKNTGVELFFEIDAKSIDSFYFLLLTVFLAAAGFFVAGFVIFPAATF
jgi:hypothetical protein